MSDFTTAEEEVPHDFPEHLLAANQLPTAENLELYKASSLGDVKNVLFALAGGGKSNFFNVTEEQKTCLHIAAEHGHAEVVKLLLERGAVINIIVAASKATALTLAAEKGQLSVIQELIKADPPVDLNHSNGYGNSALHEAARGGFLEITEALLAAGADAKVTNHKGSTPLHFLCYSPNGSAEQSERALKHAKVLLAAGCDVNTKDKRGATPLLVCCVSGRMDLITLLVANGADVLARDLKGQNAYDVAVFYQQEKLYEFVKP